ncbi:UDP-N-acetylmuramoyl-L-alanine--D-glutamate ligase [Helicobacter baculiformis]|uniref:UDP-N-acetylmuramoylalanine--D-glutamate ligase n=1 Tax=Helicobacter baculiformis TaxID=427351 RepID=A0ABV7ZIC8_9HELI|nr:UDP-N-acetylmuramoyl-L-alanine--D-glutamate ligase [Helicobacter baculiformis]
MISLLGYGRTNKAFSTYLYQHAMPCIVYDDAIHAPTTTPHNQPLLPSSAFDPVHSHLEVISPGIPPHHPLVLASQHLLSEYDYVAKLKTPPPTFFVSGTNGKTTTTEILGLLCAPFGAQVGGNIGVPLITLKDAPLWILETSSFSLHYTKHYAPSLYILLPLAQDHLSWHGGYEHYISAKLKPLSLMAKSSPVLLETRFQNHPLVQAILKQNNAPELIFYENSAHLAKQMGFDLVKVRFEEPFLLDALLALSATKLAFNQVDYDRLNSYTLQPHRLEVFKDAQARTWVNDSKATNVDATLKALDRFADRFVHLIVGGDTKQVDLSPLFERLTHMHTRIYTIGTSAPLMSEMAKHYGVNALYCGDVARAVCAIKACLKPHQIAILSPSAASLDQFSSYQERGDLFKACVLKP